MTLPTIKAAKIPMAVLGRSGLVVSRLAYGAWVTFSNQIDVDASTAAAAEAAEKEGAYALMKAAFEGGINFFDNAEIYANSKAETIMGECIQRGLAEGVWTRTDLVVATKLFFGTGTGGPNATGLSRKHIVEGTAASLARLQLAYVDVLFCHRPDPVTPIEETVRAMNHVIDKGQALYWGTSMWTAMQIEEAIGVCDRLGLIRPIVEQPEYNLFARGKMEGEFVPLFRRHGLGTTVWSPLASGVLTGKYKDRVVPPGSRLALAGYDFLRTAKLGAGSDQAALTERLRPIAERLGCTLAQLAIAWTLKNDNCTTTILGASRLSQLEENLRAIDVVPRLTADVLREIDDVVGPAPDTAPEYFVTATRGQGAIHGIKW